ncbi:MAG TPA: hypothetical protein VN038_05515 [Dyadobacter sp.]|nr:hypothetical protein [Dyadobacter sp.]
MNLHAQIIKKSGKPKFAVLPFYQYEAIVNVLSDYIKGLKDYLTALKIELNTKTWHSLEDVKAQLGIE